jgi:uncharacterized protein
MSRHRLEELQEIDTHLAQLRHGRTHSEEATVLAEVRAGVADVRRQRAVVASELGAIDARRTQHEAELSTIDARIATLDRQLLTASAKTADALNHERDSQLLRADHLSDEILTELDQAEAPGAQIAQFDAQLGALTVQEAEASVALEQMISALEAEIASCEQSRNQQAAEIDDALLARYEKLRSRMGGVAVARLDGARCTGCHVTLASGAVQLLRHAPADELVDCPECDRLLVR